MSATSKPPSSSKRSQASKTGRTSKKSADTKRQRPARSELLVCTVCGRPYRTQRGLDRHVADKHAEPAARESPTEAVERALRSIEVTPRRAVLAAMVRELAAALEVCDPTDKAKTAKELGVKMDQLLSDAGPVAGDGPDWTEDE